MQEQKIGENGVASYTSGPQELTAEHMAKTNGVIPAGSVPPPDVELNQERQIAVSLWAS
jgi:hypothetical protein